jgi:hypothetical protein
MVMTSFAITRAIMAELYPGAQLLSYQGSAPDAFREQVAADTTVRVPSQSAGRRFDRLRPVGAAPEGR